MGELTDAEWRERWAASQAAIQRFKELGLSTRIANCLTNQGASSLEDLRNWRAWDLLSIPNMGATSRAELVQAMRRHGIQFADAPATKAEIICASWGG
jgi:DNA-directed RNA polymerase alpha subunit